MRRTISLLARGRVNSTPLSTKTQHIFKSFHTQIRPIVFSRNFSSDEFVRPNLKTKKVDWEDLPLEQRIADTKKMLANGEKFTFKWYWKLMEDPKMTADGAYEIFHLAKERNVTDLVLYARLIYLLGNEKRVEEAVHVFNLMRADKIEADDTVQTILINAFVQAGQYSKAVEFIDGLKSQHITPHRVAYLLTIEGCKVGGLNEDYERLKADFESAGYKWEEDEEETEAIEYRK
eukprot:TRINITY_DN10360_c0_g1_i1.p1 TRINITY_DN10360_c0_g1~~TRINITY_DN10360_c0_g1_i1.p1  ORF type:complete len:249 (-),score=54.06 TRINITY_DN10360_c0_g1_i1:77-775(-)